MKRIQLSAVPAHRQTDYTIVLADNDRLDALDQMLTPDEMSFLRKATAQEVLQFFFPRNEGAVLIRLFKVEKDPIAAKEDARLAGNEMLKELRRYKIENITLQNTGIVDRRLDFAEGLALGSYQFLKYFTNPDKKEKPIREIRFQDAENMAAEIEELDMLLESVFLTRDMVNEPQSHFNSVQFAEAVRLAGEQHGFAVEVMGKEKIEALKMGGLLAVNRASSIPPQFCVLEWKPEQAKNAKPLVLVGKGVVYDTGGLSLKPSEGMDYMKCDMAGAASVVGVLAAVANRKLPLHVIGLIPATDNKIGENALAPGDVITMASGTTVEVVNTDAEGRLILADALHFAQKYDPEIVIDLATLTGSAVRALGNQVICYMGTAGDHVKHNLEESGFSTYERLVELPLWKEFGEDLKSNIADLKNVGSNNAGMITAGKFLEHFTKFPWLHLDIAGPAYLRVANGYRTKEGTGVGVRLIYTFLKKQYL
ncbi:MAG: leucyl aminopeptidase [Saprospiraceae bacterium]|nr:leucyl aminopeptidase [Saprospiraceae bacterium]